MLYRPSYFSMFQGICSPVQISPCWPYPAGVRYGTSLVRVEARVSPRCGNGFSTLQYNSLPSYLCFTGLPFYFVSLPPVLFAVYFFVCRIFCCSFESHAAVCFVG